jgi:hypothetical protein
MSIKAIVDLNPFHLCNVECFSCIESGIDFVPIFFQTLTSMTSIPAAAKALIGVIGIESRKKEG